MRKIRFEEEHLTFPKENQDGCVACATGLDHKVYEDFMENLDQDIRDNYETTNNRSDIIKGFIKNYSKAELAFLAEQLITQDLKKAGVLSHEPFENKEKDDDDDDVKAFKNLLKGSLDFEED